MKQMNRRAVHGSVFYTLAAGVRIHVTWVGWREEFPGGEFEAPWRETKVEWRQLTLVVDHQEEKILNTDTVELRLLDAIDEYVHCYAQDDYIG